MRKPPLRGSLLQAILQQGQTICPHKLARRFAEHLIDIGLAQPVPLTEAQVARAALLAALETYLVKQRGLSPRSIPHTVGFACESAWNKAPVLGVIGIQSGPLG